MLTSVGQDSVVGIATRYRLDGPGIDSQWGQGFPHPFRPALGTTQPAVQWIPGLFHGEQSGWGVALTTYLLVRACAQVGAISPPLPVPAKACHGVTFTFTTF
jgi:hypothetical protein